MENNARNKINPETYNSENKLTSQTCDLLLLEIMRCHIIYESLFFCEDSF